MSKKAHWETVYETKTPQEVSWTEEIPQTSLDFIHSFGDDLSASIIDVGGGDSRLVDCLLDAGYTNITVLDISAKSLERAKERLGEKAALVTWIVSDIIEFNPAKSYDIWHDRAVFHFLTNPEEILGYLQLVENAVAKNMVIGTFSENGPLRCSALDITQYSTKALTKLFSSKFAVTRCLNVDHTTPFETVQHFSFCGFEKI
jgi:ubiquinone/menaquinone biosynthesis C-methylase UbiE